MVKVVKGPSGAAESQNTPKQAERKVAMGDGP